MLLRLPSLAAAGAWLLLACTAAAAPATDTAPFHARDLVGDGVFTHGIEGPASGADGALYVVNFGIETFRSDRPGREHGP